MMLSLETLGDYLQKNPNLMTSRASLQSLLKDIFPQDRLKVNLLLMGFDEKIVTAAHARADSYAKTGKWT